MKGGCFMKRSNPIRVNSQLIVALIFICLLFLSPGFTSQPNPVLAQAAGGSIPNRSDTGMLLSALDPAAFSKNLPSNRTSGVIPTNLTLSSYSSSTAIFYEYCIDDTNDNACTAPNSWENIGLSPSVNPPDLHFNTTYYWQVRATDSTGKTTYANYKPNSSGWWSFTTVFIPPEAFKKISPAETAVVRPGQPVTLTWESSRYANYYQYCFSINTTKACNNRNNWISTVNTTVILQPFSSNITIFWQVRAFNQVGPTPTYADNSTWRTFTTQVIPPYGFPKSFPGNAAIEVPTDLTLSWGSSTFAAGYEYCIDTTNGNACTETWTSTGTYRSINLTGLSNNATYYWQVRAVNPYYTIYADGGASPPGYYHRAHSSRSVQVTTHLGTLPVCL
jgi:hypothetical protein